jgi:phospholipid N-methyltransferase
MGTGCPSSRRLAKTMASFVPLTKSKLVIELGSGTGVVTKALLQHGVAPERLVSIEQSANLANYLHKQYPQVRVIEGDAMQLCHLLGDDYQQVSAVVSGLPFRVLPQTVKQGIIKQIEKVLPQNGLLIQFTYDISGKTKLLPSQFKHISHKMVWSNLPPARVDVYRLER